jgi:hypothetical protein
VYSHLQLRTNDRFLNIRSRFDEMMQALLGFFVSIETSTNSASAKVE